MLDKEALQVALGRKYWRQTRSGKSWCWCVMRPVCRNVVPAGLQVCPCRTAVRTLSVHLLMHIYQGVSLSWRPNIQPDKPTQNGFIESFNGRFRDEYLNEHWFSDIVHARKTINDWHQDYNKCRPHSSLDYQTSVAFAADWRNWKYEEKPTHITNWRLCLVLGAGQLLFILSMSINN